MKTEAWDYSSGMLRLKLVLRSPAKLAASRQKLKASAFFFP